MGYATPCICRPSLGRRVPLRASSSRAVVGRRRERGSQHPLHRCPGHMEGVAVPHSLCYCTLRDLLEPASRLEENLGARPVFLDETYETLHSQDYPNRSGPRGRAGQGKVQVAASEKLQWGCGVCSPQQLTLRGASRREAGFAPPHVSRSFQILKTDPVRTTECDVQFQECMIAS